jgi:hypothetical protein
MGLMWGSSDRSGSRCDTRAQAVRSTRTQLNHLGQADELDEGGRRRPEAPTWVALPRLHRCWTIDCKAGVASDASHSPILRNFRPDPDPCGADMSEGGGRFSKLVAFGATGGASGILIYALFETTYTRAYAQLGVEPEEVGVSTTNIIARSVGILLALLPLLAIVVVVGLLVVIGVVALVSAVPLFQVGFWGKVFAAIVVVSAIWGIVAIVHTGSVGAAARTGVYGRMWALPDAYVGAIKNGAPTEPTKVDGLILFYMRADAARVRPVSDSGQSVGVASLVNKTVLYLGASNGISVFYDPSTDTAIKVPSDSVVISIEGGSQPFDPACSLEPTPKIFGLRIFHFQRKLSC